MIRKNIDEAIYEKYIAPTKAERSRCIGIEIEMPIVNLNKAPAEEAVIFEMSRAFRRKFGFNAVGFDANGNVNSMLDDVTDDYFIDLYRFLFPEKNKTIKYRSYFEN